MADPLLFPDNAAAKLRQLEDRVRVLESSNKLPSSAISGGAMRVLDDNGREVFVAGRFNSATSGNTVGVRASVPGITDGFASGPVLPEVETLLEINNTDGLMYPLLAHPWREQWVGGITAPMAKHTIPGDWFSYYNMMIPICPSRNVFNRCWLVGTAGSTWQMRFYSRNGDFSEEAFSDPVAVSDALGHTYWFYWSPTTLHPHIGPLFMEIQLRRTAGTGGAATYHPDALYFGATTGGGTAGVFNELGTFTP